MNEMKAKKRPRNYYVLKSAFASSVDALANGYTSTKERKDRMFPDSKKTEKTKVKEDKIGAYEPWLSPTCEVCKRSVQEHPTYFGSPYHVFGKENCPFRFVDIHK